MQDLKRAFIAGRAVGVDGIDLNTDVILPARRMLCVTFDGLGRFAFEDARRLLRESGGQHPFDDPARAEARILLVDRNFGCGSSREHAPQALMRWNKGIAAIVGESFSKIFFGNCVAIGIPCVTAAPDDLKALKRAVAADATLEVRVDLEKNEVAAGDLRIKASMPESASRQFMTGRWDSLTELLEGQAEVAVALQALPPLDRGEF